METIKNKKEQNTFSKIMKSILVFAVVLFTSVMSAQNKEVTFDVYTTSAIKASRYLLANDVSLRDCPYINCEKLTTIRIGTNVRLLAKSKTPITINGVTSRWYKVKMGPQTGWIWGGLISQKTMVSQMNPEVKFLFGEAGLDHKGNTQFQLRAVKNGTEIDKIVISSQNINHDTVSLLNNAKETYNADVINLTDSKTDSTLVPTEKSYIVFINDTLVKTTSLIAMENEETVCNYAVAYECEN